MVVATEVNLETRGFHHSQSNVAVKSWGVRSEPRDPIQAISGKLTLIMRK